MVQLPNFLPRLVLLLVCLAPAIAVAQDTAPRPPRAGGGGGAPPSDDATQLGSPPSLPANTTEQQMWPAATAEGWKQPCLITWQRSWEDAFTVSKASGKPILVCVNMDGEIASEHFAGVRYRDPETARLLEPYVCVVASVYRHTPRDYDEHGRRVPCPRFGGVTCGEHIAIETVLYDKYFEGKRVSPRHLVIDPQGKPVFDVYFSWDTQTVLTEFVEGAKKFSPPREFARDGLPIAERTKSRDVLDRVAIESAYLKGTPEVRRALLQATIQAHEVDQVELLRLAIFGFDSELARLARKSLALCDSESAVDLIAEALKVPMAEDERQALLAAAERLAAKYPRARTLTALHQGLASNSRFIDTQAWAAADGNDARSAYELSASVDSRDAAVASRPEDAGARLAFAESLLARSQEIGSDPRMLALFLQDARDSALRAEKLGAKGWRLDAVLAACFAATNQHSLALERAVAAVEGGMPSPGAAQAELSEQTAVRVLALFAQARQDAIIQAWHAKQSWPPEWLADINAAYVALIASPLGSDEHVAAHFDFLRWLGATARANEVLDRGLERFPTSPKLHERLRTRVLWDKGPEGLESTYAALLARPADQADHAALEWFAGYATLIAAEQSRRGNDLDKALVSYDQSLAHFEQNIAKNPFGRANADHYVALVLAARARLALEQGNLDRATDQIVAALQRKPDVGATPDGMNITPVDTAKMLGARLAEAGRAELQQTLQTALDALDPALLEKRPFEREIPPEGPRRGRRGSGN